MWKLTRLTVSALTLVLWIHMSNLVLGHAVYVASTPPRDGVVTELREVRLQLSEPVHVRQSWFKVYPLTPDDDPVRLRAQASEVVAAAMSIREVTDTRQDEDKRVDAGVITSQALSQEIIVRVKDDPAPGPYVFMWKVRSVDTHVTEGWFIFHYLPES